MRPHVFGAGVAERGRRAPRDEFELELLVILQDLLKRDDLGIEDDFFALGGDSLLAAVVVARLRRHFGIRLDPGVVYRSPRLLDLAGVLRSGGAIAPQPILFDLSRSPADDAPTLYCAHVLAGTAVRYLQLSQRLGSDVTVCGVQSPALGRDPVPAVCLTEMGARYAREIVARDPHGPYYLAGWCFGAFVALEIAHALRRQGGTVAGLTLIDPATREGEEEADEVAELFPALWTMVDSREHYLSLPPAERIRYMLGCGLRKGRIPPGTTAEMLLGYLSIRRAHAAAMDAYEITERYPGEIEVVYSTERGPRYRERLLHEWNGIASSLVLTPIPGSDALVAPGVSGLAERLLLSTRGAGASR